MKKITKVLKYIQQGIKKSIVVGVPDFNQNNFNTDFENLKSDFYYSKRLLNVKK